MSASCSTESKIPSYIAYVLSICTALMISYVSYSSMRKLRKDGKFNVISWMQAIKSRKSTYSSIITHLGDTITDIATLIEFGIITLNQSVYGECKEIRMIYVFTVSLISMITYRIISAFVIWSITTSFRKSMMQLLDLELCSILYLSHKYEIKGVSAPHRLINNIETVFEAAPQSVLQLVYLLRTGSTSFVVFASTLFSLIKLTQTVIAEDTLFLNIDLESEKFKKGNEMDVVLVRFKKEREFDAALSLYFFRLFDVPFKLLSYILIWFFVNGYLCVAYVILECFVAICFYWYSDRNADALFSVVATPISLGSKIIRIYWCYNGFMCIITSSIILSQAIYDGIDINSPLALILVTFYGVASIFKFPCFFGLCCTKNILNHYINKKKHRIIHHDEVEENKKNLELRLKQKNDDEKHGDEVEENKENLELTIQRKIDNENDADQVEEIEDDKNDLELKIYTNPDKISPQQYKNKIEKMKPVNINQFDCWESKRLKLRNQMKILNPIMHLVVVVHCFFLFDATNRNKKVSVSEIIFAILYLLEIGFKFIAFGFFQKKKEIQQKTSLFMWYFNLFEDDENAENIEKYIGYFYDSWKLLDFIVVLISCIIPLTYPGIPSLSNFHALRLLRLLFFVRHSSSLKRLALTLKKVIQRLLFAVVMIWFVFFIVFGIVGIQLFRGDLQQQCTSPTGERLTYISVNREYIALCSQTKGVYWGRDVSFQTCNDVAIAVGQPPIFNCTKGNENPLSGMQNYDNIFYSILQVFQTVTLQDWSSQIYNLVRGQGYITSVFFLPITFVISFFAINLILAGI